MTIQNFQRMLEEQTAWLQQLAKHQHDLQEAMLDKDYPRMEQSIDAMTSLANTIHHGEYDRQAAFRELLEDSNLAEKTNLASLLETFDPDVRKAMEGAFRRFKIAVFQARTFNEGIIAYSSSQMETMEDIIDEFYPDRHGGTYTADGQRQKTAQPLVLDHSL